MSAESLESALEGRFSPPLRAIEALSGYVDLVLKWNLSINIIGKSTADQIWQRHVLDSAQLFTCATADQRLWLDIGSGGGFPGMVVAILARDLCPDLRVGLVESDQRKAVFLSECARQLGLAVTVHRKRVESLEPQGADVLSARALAPLADLCSYAERHLKPGGMGAFLKGANLDLEIVEAQSKWSFQVDRAPSITDSKAAMVFLRDLRRV
ncbi:MAG: 16S rRNA (guanine(527)-N(7))-methyltransferase RsmG [Pseudorhodobacter sp.]|nr:MAG: 16S rRNA (guanine(527)-N(7))-methyltransferase RsmG [Pseudorhodobacter sp.]